MFEDTFQGRERRVGGVVLLGAMASRSRADQDGQTATDVERSSPTVVPGVRPLTIETLAAPLTDHTRDPGRARDGRRESVATAIDIGGSLEAIARQFQRMRDPKSSDFSDQELQIELQSRDGRDLSHGNIRKNQQLGTGLFVRSRSKSRPRSLVETWLSAPSISRLAIAFRESARPGKSAKGGYPPQPESRPPVIPLGPGIFGILDPRSKPQP